MNPAIILVIDDDVTTLKLVATTLRKHGYEVHTANDARQGLTLALADPPSLIIVDYLMPERTGLDFLQDLRAVPEMKTVPVLMLTASGLIPVVKQAIQAGVSDFMVKPFEIPKLLDRIARLLPTRYTTDDKSSS